MRDRFYRFMQGRYGQDAFSRFLLGAMAVCLLLNVVFRSRLFGALAWLLLFYGYFRIFSRNVHKRSAENQRYLKGEMKVRSFFLKKKKKLSELKEYRIYKCPECGQKIRVPRGKGRIAVGCRKCGAEFIRKS